MTASRRLVACISIVGALLLAASLTLSVIADQASAVAGSSGNSGSDPDEQANGGPDKPGGTGGSDKADQDGNNGCGNDGDFEDDNNGKCARPSQSGGGGGGPQDGTNGGGNGTPSGGGVVVEGASAESVQVSQATVDAPVAVEAGGQDRGEPEQAGLASTGTEAQVFLWGGAGLIFLGSLLLVGARRRAGTHRAG
jgi:LPXTG-motif cell wall-anchored protein